MFYNNLCLWWEENRLWFVHVLWRETLGTTLFAMRVAENGWSKHAKTFSQQICEFIGAGGQACDVLSQSRSLAALPGGCHRAATIVQLCFSVGVLQIETLETRARWADAWLCSQDFEWKLHNFKPFRLVEKCPCSKMRSVNQWAENIILTIHMLSNV